jgi:N-acetylmuramoyl-L-alanine amidase
MLALCAGLVSAAVPICAQPVVAVDVGHTLEASGARSARGRAEFEFNRELAQVLGATLAARGLSLQPVNADGRIVSLRARADAASGADFLLSIHHDSVAAEELQPWIWQGQTLDYSDEFAGHSLFVSRANPDTARSLLCARIIGARLQRLGFLPTAKNARRRAWADRLHAVHYYDELAVLRHASRAAVLFEAGVIKHRDEELRLRDPGLQARMADGIATAIAACLLNGVPADDEAAVDRGP